MHESHLTLPPKSSTPIRIEDAFAYRIYRCARRLRGHFQQLALAKGIVLSQEQWFILNRLIHEDGLPQVQLGDAVLDDRPNVTRHINALEENGLVSRQSDPNDGRKQLIYLTNEGRQLHNRFAALVPTARKQLMAGITEDELAIVIRVLARMEENI